MRKVAILIDGGYLLKRLASVRRDIDHQDVANVEKAIGQLVAGHLKQVNDAVRLPNPFGLLYRCFYYDASPYLNRGHKPVSKQAIDYSKTPEAKFRLALFEALRRRSHFAVRLGEVRQERAWILREQPQKALLARTRTVDDLTDDDFAPGLRQKAVDMRIGLDIASIVLKRQADTIILVAGDSDFVPAAKLARREGAHFILDPLWREVSPDLFEHIDAVRSGFFRPTNSPAPPQDQTP
jgi:uncharacterized LabA/DUF88 family protein